METATFTSTLTSTDWNEEWKAMQAARRHADDAAVWDEKAKSFPVKHGAQTGYVEGFLKLAGVQPGETVLDMGCGTGALATPLAQAENKVIACDFSQGMLDVMLEDHRALGISGVEVHQMSWTDDWNSFGLAEKSVDVALASRSIVTNDLRASLLKLDRVAKRRVCITLPCGPSPKTDERLLAAAGLSQKLGRDFLYAFNILAQMGVNPEVAYIPSVRMELYESQEDAIDGFSKIVRDAAAHLVSDDEMETALARLRTWLQSNLLNDERGWHLSEDRKVTWAFLAWQPK
ncbi:MAG: class I SAM-dependent methyltransferase [Eggerthellaceae bacterium]|nr:class I SAM-dependent methyltransferase [Eggerthellaceae bacterium]